MKKNIKLALAAYGLVGSISVNQSTDLEYLEDDNLFTKTSAQLIYGWEWGVSYAHAGDDIEVICCGILPPGWGGIGIGIGGGGGGGSGSGSNDASDGREGNGDSDGYQEWLEEEKIKKCNESVDALVANCQATYSEFNAGINTLCTTLGFAGSVIGIGTATLCASGSSLLTREANEWCTAQGQEKKKAECT